MAEGFEGAVLVGGASRRMGGRGDKAILLGARPVAALRAAGAQRVRAIGRSAQALGIETVPDRTPGLGPLGGIATALAAAEAPVVAVLACDLPLVTAEAVLALVGALGLTDDAAVAVASGRRHPLLAAYRTSALPHVEDVLAAGELAVHAALDRLHVVEIELADPAWATNVNTPEDLDGISSPRR